MNTALGVLGSALLLFVVVWLVAFGGVGALLAPRRGRSRLGGFLWGAVLGPIGWVVVLFFKPAPVTGALRPDFSALPAAPGLPPSDVTPDVSVSPVTEDSDVGYF